MTADAAAQVGRWLDSTSLRAHDTQYEVPSTSPLPLLPTNAPLHFSSFVSIPDSGILDSPQSGNELPAVVEASRPQQCNSGASGQGDHIIIHFQNDSRRKLAHQPSCEPGMHPPPRPQSLSSQLYPYSRSERPLPIAATSAASAAGPDVEALKLWVSQEVQGRIVAQGTTAEKKPDSFPNPAQASPPQKEQPRSAAQAVSKPQTDVDEMMTRTMVGQSSQQLLALGHRDVSSGLWQQGQQWCTLGSSITSPSEGDEISTTDFSGRDEAASEDHRENSLALLDEDCCTETETTVASDSVLSAVPPSLRRSHRLAVLARQRRSAVLAADIDDSLLSSRMTCSIGSSPSPTLPE